MQPFVLHASSPNEPLAQRDVPTDHDPLPATVVMNQDGLVAARGTRITEVQQETTDDN